MTTFLLGYLGLIAAIVLSLIRLIKGPTQLDRILSLDMIVVTVTGLIILYSIQAKSPYFLEVLILLSLLGFTTVMGYMDYLSKKDEE
ncbi:MAG: K+/H+ antiporter subunit F [Chlamydiia bacterium]|nr:K+/H+ antiporter subunit F [Chlamydiia bacterium]